MMRDEYPQLIDEHREWIGGFDGERLKQWEKLLNANAEAALCEAATRKLLIEHACDVEPFEDPSLGGVDFKCSKNGSTFHVEATCITKEVASDKSHLSHVTQPNKASYYKFLTGTIWQELSNKTSQCSGLDAPCIVAIGTFHLRAGWRCFRDLGAEDLLTGKTYITQVVDTRRGKAVGEAYQSSKLESAAFIRPDKNSPNFFEYARCPISAVLLCSFGADPIETRGILHPEPNNPFNRDLLPDIKFCKLADGYKNGLLEVEWI